MGMYHHMFMPMGSIHPAFIVPAVIFAIVVHYKLMDKQARARERILERNNTKIDD